MKIAVFSVTENGRLLSDRIKQRMEGFEITRYAHASHSDQDAVCFDKLGGMVTELWEGTDALVFVCACGIAVRCISPLVRSKQTDPAVIVADDLGRYVIPILSGHIGRANAIAARLADVIGAMPVITTATDIGGLFSPDSFAAANGLILTDLDAAKTIASTVLDGNKIGLVSEYEAVDLPEEISVGAENCSCGLYIGCDRFKKPFPVTLTLVPKNIVIGIGCKKGVSAESIGAAVSAAFEDAGISPERICAAASVDLKCNERGLIEFCRVKGIDLNFYSAEELSAVRGVFSSSEFVKSVTGVDNVCERSALRLGGGKLVIRKYAVGGVTVAAAEKPVIIDFERKIL